jgi:hypothetical protein
METREGMDLLNVPFKSFMVAYANPRAMPRYLSHSCFWICSVLLLSWPLRVLVEYKTAIVHYHLHKHFGCNYPDSTSSIGFLSRVSTMGSSDLEQTIRSNCQMVPSYSEALLMDSSGRTRPTRSRSNMSNGSVRLLPLGTSISLHNGVSSARTVIVPNNPRMPNGKIRQYGTIRRMPSTRSSDSILSKLSTWKKKKKKRRHSLAGTASLKRETLVRMQTRPQDVIVSSPQLPRSIPQPRQMVTRAASLPRDLSYNTIIDHIRINPTRCNHVQSNCPLRNIPYRRRDVNTLPGRRNEIAQNRLSTIRQSRSENRLSAPDLPPCYEEVVAMRAREGTGTRVSLMRASESFPCLDTSYHADMEGATCSTMSKVPVDCISLNEDTLPPPPETVCVEITDDEDQPLPIPPSSPDLRSSEYPDGASTISECISLPEPPSYDDEPLSPPPYSSEPSPPQRHASRPLPTPPQRQRRVLEPFEAVFCASDPLLQNPRL